MPRFGHLGITLVACAALFASCCAGLAQGASTGDSRTIVFVCLHGAVNSQMAAAYFNKAAKERDLSYTAVSRGIDLYPTIPVRILDGLALDGLDPVNSPRELSADASNATRVFAFDAISTDKRGGASVAYWAGVPLGINDYGAAREEIVRRIDDLLPTLSVD